MSRVMQSRRRPARSPDATLRLVASWRVRGDCLRRLGVEVDAASARLVVRFSEGEGFTAAVEALDAAAVGGATPDAMQERAIDPALLGLNGHATVTETDDGSLHLTDPDGFAMTFGACAAAADASGAAGGGADAAPQCGNGDRESSLLYVRLPCLERCGGGRYHLEGGWVEAIEAAGA